MPTYDYICQACGHELEIFQSMSESPKRKCPQCGALKLKRQIGAGAGLIFKGSGFYQTDYRSESYKSAAKKDSEAGAPKKSDDKGESPAKPAAGETKPSDTKKPDAKKPGSKKSGDSK